MKQLVQDNIWKDRIDSANKYYKQWEALFKCKILEEYYEGHQWKSQREMGYDPYIINKFYETIQIKIAEFIPTFLKFIVSSKPANTEYDLETAMASAQLKEDILNSIIQDTRRHFNDEVEACYKDSFFRFGIMEIGYAADWILNPQAPKPLLKGQTEKYLSNRERRKIAQEPAELPVNERVYFKHIPARNFRVGGIDHKYLERCSWIGYYEYVNKDDLLALPKLMNRDKIELSITVDPDPDVETNDRNTDNHKGHALKLWHIWDQRAMMRLMVLDSPSLTIYQRKFKRTPLFDFRPDFRAITEGFYPIPPTFHWLSPQNEINEIREMLRAHRRRFVRKYQIQEGMIDDVELEKFETGPDGSLVKVKQPTAIQPIENADLGQAVAEATATSADDFNRISATSDQQRGVTDRATATESKIVADRGAIRENKDRDRVVSWLARAGREILLTVRDNFALGIWIQLTSPEGEKFLGSVNDMDAPFKWVTTEQLNDGYDFRIDVDVSSLSATAAADEKQHFLEFLGTLTQFPMLAFSPLLVREAAYRIGYRNIKAIRELQKQALLMEHGRMLQLQAQAGGSNQQPQPQNGPAGQQIVAQQTPPTNEEITNQLKNQLLQ